MLKRAIGKNRMSQSGQTVVSNIGKQNPSFLTIALVLAPLVEVESPTFIRPEFGFGPAAAACARRERFHPARDGAGQPVRATALVRVHFER